MLLEENKDTEKITSSEENSISVEPKQEVVEDIPIVKETQPVEQVENSEIKKTDEIPQTETEPPQPTTEAEQPQSIQQNQTQEIPTQPQQPQIKTVEKIVYRTDPNIVTKLLNKARAKIQERKRKKLDKIMKLFELNPRNLLAGRQVSNSDIQKLLRTTKRSSTRYLNILEKEQKIIQIGKAGRSVKYTKKQ